MPNQCFVTCQQKSGASSTGKGMLASIQQYNVNNNIWHSPSGYLPNYHISMPSGGYLHGRLNDCHLLTDIRLWLIPGHLVGNTDTVESVILAMNSVEMSTRWLTITVSYDKCSQWLGGMLVYINILSIREWPFNAGGGMGVGHDKFGQQHKKNSTSLERVKKFNSPSSSYFIYTQIQLFFMKTAFL